MLNSFLKSRLETILGIEKADRIYKDRLLSDLEELIKLSVLDFILSKLNIKDQEIFLELTEDEDKAIQFLNQKIPNFESEITRIITEELININS